ncbi:MAG: hypothetical protein ACE5KV_00270, partial [Thermoplasmata archaeon]
ALLKEKAIVSRRIDFEDYYMINPQGRKNETSRKHPEQEMASNREDGGRSLDRKRPLISLVSLNQNLADVSPRQKRLNEESVFQLTLGQIVRK